MIELSLSRDLRLGLLGFGFLLPVAVGLLVRIATTEGTHVSAPAVVLACEATRLDAACPEGQRCAAGLCMPAQVAEPGRAGERCEDGRGCGLGLGCHRGRCEDEAALARIVAPPVCRVPEVERVLAALGERCVKALGKDGAALGECDDEAWRVISGERDFDAILRGLPERMSVFFPHDMPDEGRRWPDPSQRATLRSGIARHIDPVRGGKLNFLIARASTSGDPTYNDALARRRLELVDALVRASAEQEVVVRSWVLAATAEDSLEARRMEIAERAIVASTAEELAELQKLPQLTNTELGRRETELRNMVNRVVDVVPLPCDGSEFFPRPAFYTRSEVRR